jgi:phenylalanine-4-hydroxylase
MAIGKKVVSAFAGAADPDSFELSPPISPAMSKPIKSQEQLNLEHLYRTVNDIKKDPSKLHLLPTLFNEVRTNHPHDWLLSLEIFQILKNGNVHPSLQNEIELYLNEIKARMSKVSHLIEDGLLFIL